MAARLAAVVVAIAMVAVALAVRDRLDDDGGGEDGARAGALVLGCVTELAAVCEEVDGVDGVEVSVGQAGEVAAALAGTDGAYAVDAWLTLAPWPAIVDGRRTRAGSAALFDDEQVLARSPLVLALWPDRRAVLAEACGGAVAGWKCVADAAAAADWPTLGGDEAWGAVKVGLPDPSSFASGLLALGQFTVHWFGREDIGRFDLENEDGYRRALVDLENALRARSGDELEQMLRAPAALDMAMSTEARAVTLVARLASGRPRPEVIYPAPMATADVVLATTPGGRGRRLRDAVAEPLAGALAASGWRVAGRPGEVAPGAPALPETNSLPPADVLEAIGEVWAEAAR